MTVYFVLMVKRRLTRVRKLSLNQYNELLAQCSTTCISKSQKCESAFQSMLLDVSPNGQYGQIKKEAAIENGNVTVPEINANQNDITIKEGFNYAEVNPRIFPLSVFNDGNLLPYINSFYPLVSNPYWRYPFYNGNTDGNGAPEEEYDDYEDFE
jgi:hypothetical protein